jgi:hypothetical protein
MLIIMLGGIDSANVKCLRPDPKPSLDVVMSQAQMENKVAGYLRNSQALEDHWQRPITAEQ